MNGTERLQTLLERWQEQLLAWAPPPHLPSQAGTSSAAVSVFARRVDHQLAHPSPLVARALDALPEGGTVLDVGAGGGAASLPLASRAARLIAVDSNESMLDELARRASALGLPVEVVHGSWPEVADTVPSADVVVCAHVLYNVVDVPGFMAALTRHARRRVVYEFTQRHPLAHLNPLWRRLHGLDRPEGPTADDAIELLSALGLDIQVERWRPMPFVQPFDELVEFTREALRVPPERAGQVAAGLQELGVDTTRATSPLSLENHVTVWWPGMAPAADKEDAT